MPRPKCPSSPSIDEGLALELDRDLQPALTGELERVAGEVREALRDAPRIAVGERKVCGHRRREVEPLVGGQGQKGCAHLLHDIRHGAGNYKPCGDGLRCELGCDGSDRLAVRDQVRHYDSAMELQTLLTRG